MLKAGTEAIVNAANEQLSHGGGLAGFLSGQSDGVMQRESDKWLQSRRPLNTGDAVILHLEGTPFKSCGLKHVVHAVGPDC